MSVQGSYPDAAQELETWQELERVSKNDIIAAFTVANRKYGSTPRSTGSRREHTQCYFEWASSVTETLSSPEMVEEVPMSYFRQ